MSEHEPRYQSVIDWVMQEIKDGNLNIGNKLPTEKELCEKFGLSRQTIRHATGVLEKKKICTRVRGSGTYVGVNHVSPNRPRTMNIAVMLTFANSYIFAPVLMGISSLLEERGYSAQISFTNNSTEKEGKILSNLLENDNIDGIIAEPSKGALPNPNRKYYEELRGRGIPILFINAAYRDMDIPCIRLDDERVAEEAVKLIISRGHKRIGGIFHAEDAQGPERYVGYMKGIRGAGLIPEEEHIVWLDTVAVGNMEPMMDYMLKRLEGCTAVFTYNDEVAAQMITGCEKRGMRLPEDLSIVSIDNADIADSCSPKITTFPHPKEILGRRAAATILEMLDDPMYDGNYLFMPEPIIRESLCDHK